MTTPKTIAKLIAKWISKYPCRKMFSFVDPNGRELQVTKHDTDGTNEVTWYSVTQLVYDHSYISTEYSRDIETELN